MKTSAEGRTAGPDASPPVARVIALGASNLTRGLPAVVGAARDRFGPEVQVLAALGLGRSYGATSRVVARTLPGILQSGLWKRLDALAPAPTRALITDVGNDILYGSPPSEILGWVEECVARLQRHRADITLTNLPVFNVRRLSRSKFLLFRTVLFSRCRLSLEQVLDRVEQVASGLEAMAAVRGLRLVRLQPEWYGFDPLHIRPGLWRAVWTEILGAGPPAQVGGGPGWWEALRLYALPPERQWLLGLERVKPQDGVTLGAGGRVWLY